MWRGTHSHSHLYGRKPQVKTKPVELHSGDKIKSGLLFLWKLDLILTRYLELLTPRAECLQETKCRRTTLYLRVQLSVRERRVSSRLPFAYLSHDTASHAAWAGLGPPPGPAWLFSSLNSSVWLPQRCLTARSRVPPLSGTLNPGLLAPLTPPPPSGPAKNPAPQAERRRRGVAPRPSLKSSKTKKKRKKTVLPGWPNASLVVWQQDLWQSLRYCWSQANSLHSQELFPRPGLQTGRQRRCWEGGRTIRRQETKRERRKKAGWRHTQQRKEMGSDSRKGNRRKKIRLKKRQETWRKKQ